MFTGTAVVKEVSDGLVRVTGLSLLEGATGTLGLFENTGTPDVRLPEAFKPRDYQGAESQHVSLQDSVQCWFVYVGPLGNTPDAVSVVKTGTTPQDFQIALQNHTGLEGPGSGDLEIYVRFH